MAEVAAEEESDEEDEEHSEESGDEEEEEGEESTTKAEASSSTASIPPPPPHNTAPLSSSLFFAPEPSLAPLESLSLSNLDLSEALHDSDSATSNSGASDGEEEEGSETESNFTETLSHRRHRPSTRVPPPSAADVGAIVTDRLARLKKTTERRHHGGKPQSANVLGKHKGSKMKSDARRAIKSDSQF